MSYIHNDTLVVCFLSSEPVARAYEADLIAELNRKRLGFAKVIVGEDIPSELLRDGDLAIELPGVSAVGDDNSAILHVVVGQLLGFGRCRAEEISPDSPSSDGVIHRVVETFTIHPTPANGI
jgi:tagatose-6-phosphate ketose/aldose isomerase